MTDDLEPWLREQARIERHSKIIEGLLSILAIGLLLGAALIVLSLE